MNDGDTLPTGPGRTNHQAGKPRLEPACAAEREEFVEQSRLSGGAWSHGLRADLSADGMAHVEIGRSRGLPRLSGETIPVLVRFR